jgi:hypothetical protein
MSKTSHRTSSSDPDFHSLLTFHFSNTLIPPSPILSGRFHDMLATENTYPPPGMLKGPHKPLGEEQAVYYHLTHGARDVQHVIVPEMNGPAGNKAIFFVFKDLMVAEVGQYVAYPCLAG